MTDVTPLPRRGERYRHWAGGSLEVLAVRLDGLGRLQRVQWRWFGHRSQQGFAWTAGEWVEWAAELRLEP